MTVAETRYASQDARNAVEVARESAALVITALQEALTKAQVLYAHLSGDHPLSRKRVEDIMKITGEYSAALYDLSLVARDPVTDAEEIEWETKGRRYP